jgi:hypothetical protein
VTGNIVISATATTPDTRTNWAHNSLAAADMSSAIYNNGLGYKNGTRVSSSGSEKSDTTATGICCTGYIPIDVGNVVEVSSPVESAFGPSTSVKSSITLYNSQGVYVGQMATNGLYGKFGGTGHGWTKDVLFVNGRYEWTVPNDVDDTDGSIKNNGGFIRLSVGSNNGDVTGADLTIRIRNS